MRLLHPVEVLAALITPGVLISATALLLLSSANRLGRVNDRLQSLIAEIEEQPDTGAQDDKVTLRLQQLGSLL